ncbi:MAG: hypothetical protein J5780_03975, partial [Treponema sp.]|nr:hypothetical protein [Treponema sp.]
GLKKHIENAEYSLGLKPRPIENAVLKKAEELASLAEKTLSQAGRDEVLLSHAKSIAEEALALNPENGTALKVLDEAARRKGEAPAVTLSAQDEDLYNKALSDYRNGSFKDASIKIETLLKNPTNARSAKILKLKENIARKM